MFNNRIASGALIALITSNGFAAPETPDDPFVDMPVVLSSNTLEKHMSQSPVSISSIDRELIEASGARTIPEVLRLIPGIAVGHSVNDFGDKPLLVVTYHGHSDQFSKQMNVLIDGRSIYDPLLGGVNWYNIPIAIDDIERIEVTRGPNASTYGSNSFQAVINIITRHASEDQGHYAKVNAGNHDIFDATYRYGGNSGDLDYRVTIATVNDDGQDRADGNNADDDVNSGMIDYRLDYQINTKNQLTYQGNYGRTDQQAEAGKREPINPERIIEDTNAYQLLRWDSTVNSEQSFVLTYFFNYLDEQDDFISRTIDLPPVDPFTFPVSQSFTSQRHNLEFTHFITPREDINLVWGASVQKDRVDSDFFFQNTGKVTRNTYRLYGNAVFNIDSRNTIDIGALIEKSDGTDTDVSPRIAYLHHFNEKHTVRIGASQAIRTPFLFEQEANAAYKADVTAFGGTVPLSLHDQLYFPLNNLETEKITTVELGYYGQFLNNKLLISTRIFQDKLEDLIIDIEIPDPTGDDNVPPMETFVFDNLHATTVRGIEAEMDYTYKSLRVVASGAIMDITSDDPVRVGKSREYEESAPDHSFSLLAMRNFRKHYFASIGFYYYSDMAWMDANHNNTCEGGGNPNGGCGFRNTRGYRALDVRAGRNFKIGDENASVAIVAKNLLDEYNDYDSHPSSLAPAVEQNLVAFVEFKLKIQ